jgi:hypothetical protein
MKIIITESQLNRIIKEGSLSDKLFDQIKQNGWRETAELVGGTKNLLSIIGKSKKNVIDYLLSSFKNLTLEKRGGSIFLMSGGLSLLEKSSSLWGSNLKLFNDHFKSRIDENSMNLYNNYKEDLIRELVSQFPKLHSEKVDVFKDASLYHKYYTFDL